MEKQARVAESTLKTISVEPKALFMVAPKERKTKGKGKNSPVKTIKVDPRVWKVAIKLADNNRKRILIRSTTEVSVLNHPIK